jgi:hypothetical protein
MYSSIQASDVLVLNIRCQLINFVVLIFPLFIPEMPAGCMFYIVQIKATYNAFEFGLFPYNARTNYK